MTATEALEKIRNHILNGGHSDGIIAPILNLCDEALESPKMKEAREIRARNGGRNMKKNSDENDAKKSKNANQKITYEDAVQMLRFAHATFLEKAWEIYKDHVFVYSIMHTVHHAMMDFERDFLNMQEIEKAEGPDHINPSSEMSGR